MSNAHFGGGFARQRNVYQFALADTGAPFACQPPVELVADEFWPIGKRTALQRFHAVNRAAAFAQEHALGVAWDAESAQALRAVDVTLFECSCGQSEEGSDARDIVLGQIDETLLFATGGATGLAFESQGPSF